LRNSNNSTTSQFNENIDFNEEEIFIESEESNEDTSSHGECNVASSTYTSDVLHYITR
jgi:hypothetical protein